MKRELKLFVIVVPERDCVPCWVIKQTHRGSDFAHGGNHEFRASNGIPMRSLVCPSCEGPGICVRGGDTAEDGRGFFVPLGKLPKIQAAVKEYNETNGGACDPRLPSGLASYETLTIE